MIKDINETQDQAKTQPQSDNKQVVQIGAEDLLNVISQAGARQQSQTTQQKQKSQFQQLMKEYRDNPESDQGLVQHFERTFQAVQEDMRAEADEKLNAKLSELQTNMVTQGAVRSLDAEIARQMKGDSRSGKLTQALRAMAIDAFQNSKEYALAKAKFGATGEIDSDTLETLVSEQVALVKTEGKSVKAPSGVTKKDTSGDALAMLQDAEDDDDDGSEPEDKGPLPVRPGVEEPKLRAFYDSCIGIVQKRYPLDKKTGKLTQPAVAFVRNSMTRFRKNLKRAADAKKKAS